MLKVPNQIGFALSEGDSCAITATGFSYSCIISVVRYKLGSLHKGTVGFVRGVLFCIFVDEDLSPITERALDLFLFPYSCIFFILEVFLRIELGQQKFCQKAERTLD